MNKIVSVDAACSVTSALSTRWKQKVRLAGDSEVAVGVTVNGYLSLCGSLLKKKKG